MKSNTKQFYERKEVIHEVLESDRSKLCYSLLKRIIKNKQSSNSSTKINLLDFVKLVHCKHLVPEEQF